MLFSAVLVVVKSGYNNLQEILPSLYTCWTSTLSVLSEKLPLFLSSLDSPASRRLVQWALDAGAQGVKVLFRYFTGTFFQMSCLGWEMFY